MVSFRIVRMIKLGIKSLILHKLRSALTVLGIIFGVSSVIAMLSIGEGASWEAQKMIRILGSSNIIIKSVKPPDNKNASTGRTFVVEYGLTYDDAKRIASTIPSVKAVVPMRNIRKDMRYRHRLAEGQVIILATFVSRGAGFSPSPICIRALMSASWERELLRSSLPMKTPWARRLKSAVITIELWALCKTGEGLIMPGEAQI